MNKKIVFCGGGNMAEGMIRGILNNKVVTPAEITVNELLPARCSYLSETYGITAVTDASDAIKEADMAVIAVNPHQVSGVASMLAPLVKKDAVIVSIAAGVMIETIAAAAGADKKIARVMPNTLSLSGNGYSAVCLTESCSEDDAQMVDEMLNALGQVMHIEENMFDTFTGFSCTGPLWIYKMIEAMTDAGVYSGFARADARDIVIRNMIGAATVLSMTGEHPAMKVDQMTSSGGTTIEALKVLQQEGFANAIMTSVDACVSKANSLK